MKQVLYGAYLGGLGIAAFVVSLWIFSLALGFEVIVVWR